MNFPSNPHFSPLIGATHNSKTSIWMPGEISSAGMEVMAETGATGTLTTEINKLINSGGAKTLVAGSGMPKSPGNCWTTARPTLVTARRKNFRRCATPPAPRA